MFRVGLAEANTAATAARSHCASSEPEPAESEQIWLNAHRSGRNGFTPFPFEVGYHPTI